MPFCNNYIIVGHNFCTQSGLQAYFGAGETCANYWGGGVQSWGGTPDCCTYFYCSRFNSIPWQPATCD